MPLRIGLPAGERLILRHKGSFSETSVQPYATDAQIGLGCPAQSFTAALSAERQPAFGEQEEGL